MPKYTRGYRDAYIPTLRQLEVLSRAAHGKGNKEIAAELGIGVATVRSHMDAINLKLDARDRTQAVYEATRRGWLDKETGDPVPRVVVLVPHGAPPVEVIYYLEEGQT